MLVGAECAHSCLLLLWTMWQPVCSLGPKICSMDSFQIAHICHNALKIAQHLTGPSYGLALRHSHAHLSCSSHEAEADLLLIHILCVHPCAQGTTAAGLGTFFMELVLLNRARSAWCPLFTLELGADIWCLADSAKSGLLEHGHEHWPQPSAVALDAVTVT